LLNFQRNRLKSSTGREGQGLNLSPKIQVSCRREGTDGLKIEMKEMMKRNKKLQDICGNGAGQIALADEHRLNKKAKR